MCDIQSLLMFSTNTFNLIPLAIWKMNIFWYFRGFFNSKFDTGS